MIEQPCGDKKAIDCLLDCHEGPVFLNLSPHQQPLPTFEDMPAMSRQTKTGEPELWRPESSAPVPEKTPETAEPAKPNEAVRPKEYGGRRDGLDPTRYGDWEKNGRCIDF
jgi:hypothetical protein